MNWTCSQVIKWCKSFIGDDEMLSRFEGQLFCFLPICEKSTCFPFECSIE